jgi:hypothetical protein
MLTNPWFIGCSIFGLVQIVPAIIGLKLIGPGRPRAQLRFLVGLFVLWGLLYNVGLWLGHVPPLYGKLPE